MLSDQQVSVINRNEGKKGKKFLLKKVYERKGNCNIWQNVSELTIPLFSSSIRSVFFIHQNSCKYDTSIDP